MQKQAKAIKNELKKIQIEAEENGVTVVMTADQEIISIDISESLLSSDNKIKLEKSLIKAIQKASKKAQQVSADKMKSVMGDMGFPGAN